MQPVRTNNELDGWHGRLNRHAGRGQIQFYLLVDLLYEEGKFVNIQSEMVRDEILERYQRKEYKVLNEKTVCIVVIVLFRGHWGQGNSLGMWKAVWTSS